MVADELEAIKCILPIASKLRDYIDEREDELDTYEKLRNAIMTWGLRKKKALHLSLLMKWLTLCVSLSRYSFFPGMLFVLH